MAFSNYCWWKEYLFGSQITSFPWLMKQSRSVGDLYIYPDRRSNVIQTRHVGKRMPEEGANGHFSSSPFDPVSILLRLLFYPWAVILKQGIQEQFSWWGHIPLAWSVWDRVSTLRAVLCWACAAGQQDLHPEPGAFLLAGAWNVVPHRVTVAGQRKASFSGESIPGPLLPAMSYCLGLWPPLLL